MRIKKVIDMKHLHKALLLITVLILSCILLGGCAQGSGNSNNAEPVPANDSNTVPDIPVKESYETKLFDTGFVHKIEISIDEKDWNKQVADPTAKKKFKVDVTIDGELFKDVSFATKGNSSLVFVAADPDTDRYSYKINFGKYIDGQTYYGLDKLSLNNSFSDATYLKDYLSYRIFAEAGVPAPLCSFVWLKVNGQDRGLYLAVEDESDGFLNRVYGGEGVIYKPESKGLGLTVDDVPYIMEHGLPDPPQPHGADLVYTDDDPESYPDIFNNAETDSDDGSADRVIASLKKLSERKDLDVCLDTSEIIRYFAAHNYVLNYDSYTVYMLHNLVLYENNGKLALLPWDYNLAYSTFTPGTGKDVLKNATDIVNTGIDTPLIGTTEEERPMWSWIVEDGNYLKEYHAAMDSLIFGYIESGRMEREFDLLHRMLLPYVEKDPTAFYTAEEYAAGYEALISFCEKRVMSVRLQLEGGLSTDSATQSDKNKVDASDVRIIDMGATVFGGD